MTAPRVDRWCSDCREVVTVLHGEMRGHAVVEVPQLHALSVFDAWAWAIDSLPPEKAKRVENRPWPPYQWVRGRRWLAMHVPQKWDEGARYRVGQLCGEVPPSRETLVMAGRRSRITAMVRIDGYAFPADVTADHGVGSMPLAEKLRPWWYRSQFGWVIGDVFHLPRPVGRLAGRQKIWRVPVPAALAVAEQLPPHILAALAQPAR